MSVLICGSLAYDTTMVCDDKFKLQYAADRSHKGEAVELYYLIPDIQRHYGGCAGNIAYNLKLLGQDPLVMATVGTDFAGYAGWLDSKGIKRKYIKALEHSYTAQTFITQDMDDNKIIAFHAGAMNFSHFNSIPMGLRLELGVIAPDGYEGMLAHIRQLNQLPAPYLFYPGSAIPQFSADELLESLQMARWAFVNEKGLRHIQQNLKLKPEDLGARMDAFIVGRGLQGASIYTADACYQMPSIKAGGIYELSGCDDAFCAGLIYGLTGELDWETTGRIAVLMWSIASQNHGTQSYSFNMEKFKKVFEKTFGYALIA